MRAGLCRLGVAPLAVACLLAACGNAGDEGSPQATTAGSSTDESPAATTTTPAAPATTFSLATVAGDVQVDGAAAATATELAADSVVVVGAASSVVLVASDGSSVSLGSDSQVTSGLDAAGMAMLRLDRGSLVWTQPADATEGSFVVRVAGLAARSAGARGVALCDATGCAVGALDGQVTVEPDGGAPVVLAPLEYVDAGTVAPVAFPPSALLQVPAALVALSGDALNGLRPLVGSDATASLSMLDGDYTVRYTTVASSREDVTGEGVDRDVSVRTVCERLACTLVFTTELKAADGSITTSDTELRFDGTQYVGSSTLTQPCLSTTLMQEIPDALTYTGDTTLVVTASDAGADGVAHAIAFEVTIEETNVVSQEGRDAQCVISFAGDPYEVQATTVGAGNRTI